MRGFEDFFSPLVPHPLHASTSRSPWGGETKGNSDDSDDPNGSTSTSSAAAAVELPGQHPSQLPPQRPSELHPELAPASVSSIGSIPSPNNNLESNRDLRRRLLAGGAPGVQREATAIRAEYEYPSRDRRASSRRYPRRVYACRICACLAALAILGIFLITRIVLHFKTEDAPLATADSAGDGTLLEGPGVPGVVDEASPAPTPKKGAAPAAYTDLRDGGDDIPPSIPLETGLASPLRPFPPALPQKPKIIATHDDDLEPEEECEDDDEPCWIFMHMEKSGGGGARQVAAEHWRKDSLVFDTVQWRRGDSFAADIMSSHWRLLHGGCVEALRNEGARRCKWVTIFRHPVARLLSAYDHCRNAPKDPLCPTAQSADLATFAERWGNFAMRQFALADVSPSSVKRWANSGRVSAGSSVWYLVKDYLTRGGIAEDEVLEGMLERVQGLLSTRYAAVGIAEDIDATMALFDRALSMGGLDWSSSLGKLETDGQDGEYDMRGSAAFRRALANPRVASAIRLDMLLYEHAMNVFNEQVARYGVL